MLWSVWGAVGAQERSKRHFKNCILTCRGIQIAPIPASKLCGNIDECKISPRRRTAEWIEKEWVWGTGLKCNPEWIFPLLSFVSPAYTTQNCVKWLEKFSAFLRKRISRCVYSFAGRFELVFVFIFLSIAPCTFVRFGFCATSSQNEFSLRKKSGGDRQGWRLVDLKVQAVQGWTRFRKNLQF